MDKWTKVDIFFQNIACGVMMVGGVVLIVLPFIP